MPVFPGPDFALETVTVLDFYTIRVKFTQDPKRVDPATANDALNPSNYSLLGPGRNWIRSVIATVGDPQSVDCTCAAPLLIGGWQLTATNVVEDSLAALVPPTTINFLVTTQPTQTPLPGGTTNSEAAAVLRKLFNPTLKGHNWDAILAAIGAGDKSNWNNAKLAFDQMFISSASGKYLDQRAGDQGEKRPKDVGMPDDLFRQLAITIKNKKLTEEAILEVLNIYYGIDSVRANTTSGLAEPYAFNDGDTLSLLIDEKQQVTVNFKATHFARIAVSYAVEVAAEITRALRAAGTNAFAVAFKDPATNLNHVRIYSGSLGLSSGVRVVGGVAQTVLQFPTSLFSTPFTSTNWVWAPSTVTPGNLRFTGGSFFNLDLLQVGDLVYVYGAPFVAAGIQGTFTVAATGSYFDVSNPFAVRQQWFEIFDPSVTGSSGTQTSFTAMMFFRPHKATVYDNPRHVLVSQTGGTVNVSIPATTQVVVRGPGTAAYLNGQAGIPVSTLERQDGTTVKVTLAAPHQLAVGDQIQIDSVMPTGASAPEAAATPSGNFAGDVATGTTAASLMTTVSLANTFQGTDCKAMRLREGLIMVVGGQSIAAAVGTALTSPAILEILTEVINGNGGRQQTYKWTNLAARSYTIGLRQFGASVISNNLQTISDNRVLVTGGTNGDDITGVSKNNWNLFTYANSPAVNSQINGTMPVARAGHAQASLAFYELICGGWTVAGTPINTAYTFDTILLTWTVTTGAMQRARMKHQLSPYQVGSHVRGLATGGQSATAILNHCEVYEADTGLWRSVGAMSYARYDHAAVTLPDGRTIVFGGTGYNPSQSNFNPTHTGRVGAGAITLTGTKVGDVVVGVQNLTTPGSASASFEATITVADQIQQSSASDLSAVNFQFFIRQPQMLSSVEVYSPVTEIWDRLDPMRTARTRPIATYLPTLNAIYVTGAGSTTIEILDVATMTWSKPIRALGLGYVNSVGALLGVDTLAVIGGTVGIGGDTAKNNYLTIPASDSVWAGGLNRIASVVTAPDSTHFTYKTSDNNYRKSYTLAGAGVTVTPSKALPAPPGVPGPFSYDVKTGMAITAVKQTLVGNLNKGASYQSIALDTGAGPNPALSFPDAVGYLVFNFGYKNQVGPVRYLGRLDASHLLLDGAFKFTDTILTGSKVVLLSGKSPFDPPSNKLIGNFYVTGSAAGRLAAERTIDEITAAGLNIDVDVVYPGDIGLGSAGFPKDSNYKISDIVGIFSSDDEDVEIAAAKVGE